MDTASHSGSMLHRAPSFAGDLRSLANHSMSDFSELIGRARRRTVDEVSDTSSQAERKFANLLGGENPGEETDLLGSTLGGGPARNVGHRLYRDGTQREQARAERLQEVREQVLLQEMAQLTQRPCITSRARQKPGKGLLFSDHAMIWNQRREESIRRAARSIRAQQSRELTGTPHVDPNSAAIVESSEEYVGPISGWETHFAKYCAKRAIPLSPQLFTPNINANAVRVDVDKSISDRLYEDSKSRLDRLKERVAERMESEKVDPATGRPLFTPQALRAPQSQSQSQPQQRSKSCDAIGDAPAGSAQRQRTVEEVSEWLYGSHGEREERIRRLQAKQRDAELTFSPAINKRSAVLGEKVRKPLYTPNMRKPSRSPDPRTNDPNLTGRPLTNHATGGVGGTKAAAAARASDVQEFLRRNERCDHVRQAKIDALRRAMEERDSSSCTFQPRINPKSVEIFHSTNVYGVEMPSPTSEAYPNSPAQEQPAFSPHGGGGGQLQQPQQAAMRQPRFTPSEPTAMSARRSAPISSSSMSGASPPPPFSKSASPTPLHVQQPPTSRTAVGSGATPKDAAPKRRSLSPNHPSPSKAGRASAAAGGGGALSPADVPQVDEYISNFERQMYAVLDEWRKLEEI